MNGWWTVTELPIDWAPGAVSPRAEWQGRDADHLVLFPCMSSRQYADRT
jgi:hypothetical protein